MLQLRVIEFWFVSLMKDEEQAEGPWTVAETLHS